MHMRLAMLPAAWLLPCARRRGRVKRSVLSVGIYVCMYVYIYVCDQKKRPFTLLAIKTRQQNAFYHLLSEFLVFHSGLQSRTSYLSRAMAMSI